MATWLVTYWRMPTSDTSSTWLTSATSGLTFKGKLPRGAREPRGSRVAREPREYTRENVTDFAHFSLNSQQFIGKR